MAVESKARTAVPDMNLGSPCTRDIRPLRPPSRLPGWEPPSRAARPAQTSDLDFWEFSPREAGITFSHLLNKILSVTVVFFKGAVLLVEFMGLNRPRSCLHPLISSQPFSHLLCESEAENMDACAVSIPELGTDRACQVSELKREGTAPPR